MSAAAPWAKVWWTWYSSRSHVSLGPVALALGAPLMLLGRAYAKRHSDDHGDASCDGASDGSGDLVWLRDKSGKPITAGHIAGITRFSKADVESALGELVEAETLVVSEDGVYGFPNFWRYQESAAAARTRKYRGKSKRHGDGHGDVACDAVGDGSCDDKRIEDRGKRSASATQKGVAGSERKARAKPAALAALETALVEEFKKLGDSPPAMTNSLATRACRRVRDYADQQNLPVETSARLLAASYVATGATSAWKLLDVPMRPRVALASKGTRLSQAPGTTAADFEDCEDVETQIARWGNAGK
jgi:hypothetical protein